jgi:hypothetical protein
MRGRADLFFLAEAALSNFDARTHLRSWLRRSGGNAAKQRVPENPVPPTHRDVRSLVAAMAYPDMAALKAAFNGPARRGNEAENIPRICCRATAFAAAAR